MVSAGGNQLKIVAWVDDQVSGKLAKMRDSFDNVGASKGFQAIAMGVGMGVGMAALNAVTGAVGQLGDAFKATIEAASEEQQTQARLRAALDANVPAWGKNTEAIEKRLQAGRRLAFDDEDLRQSLGSLVGATHDVNKAFEIQSIAMDLARFKNISLQEASDALIRVEAGQYRMLKSLGIEIKANATQQEALAAVQRVTAGQAAAYTETFAGAQAKLSIAIEEVQEAIGKDLLPVLTDLATVLANDVIPAVAELWQGLKDLWAFMEDPGGDWKGVDRLEAVAEFLGRDIDTTSYESALEDVTAATAEMAGDVVSYSENAMIGMASAFEAGADDAATAFDKVVVRMGQTAADVTRQAAAVAKGIAEGIRNGRADIDAALDQLAADIGNAMSRTAEISRLGGLLTGRLLAKGLVDSDPQVRAAAEYARDLILARLDELTAGAASRGFAAGNALARGFFGATAAQGKRFAAEFAEATPEMQAANKFWQDLVKTFKPANIDTRLLTSSMKSLAGATKSAGQAAADAAAKIKDAISAAFQRVNKSASAYFDSVHEKNLRAIEDARKLSDAMFGRKIAAVNAEVQAYRDQLEAKRDARREADLREAVATAESAEDRASAEEALSDFLEDQTLKRMERAAEARIDELEAQRDAANERYDLAVESENKIYEARKAAWDKASEALEASLAKQKITYKDAAAQILALLASFKEGYVAVGTALGTAVGTAIGTGIGSAAIETTVVAMNKLAQITEEALALITSAPTGLSSRGWGKMSPEEQDRAYFQALVDSGAYQWDVGAGGGYRVSPTGTSSPDTLNPGAPPETLAPSGGGAPVVIKLTMDGREIAEVVDRNLLYRYRLGTTG